MTNKEAIKYLQQLYPNGGHCWLDKQRIEAIGMAVKALQEEPISEDLEEASKESVDAKETKAYKVPLSKKLSWLSNMLWGGSVLLAFEHVWHGEVVAWFPFLTAMSDPNDAAEMFHEMATVGVCMALLITFVWAGICIVADRIVKRAEDPVPEV